MQSAPAVGEPVAKQFNALTVLSDDLLCKMANIACWKTAVQPAACAYLEDGSEAKKAILFRCTTKGALAAKSSPQTPTHIIEPPASGDWQCLAQHVMQMAEWSDTMLLGQANCVLHILLSAASI